MGVPFKAKNGLDANSNKIVNVSNPTAAQDAATKLYVDNAVGTGLPSQTGNSGKFLTTDATTASWSLVPVAGINATGTPSITTYLRGDGTWATVASGSGDVVGPASSTDNAIVRFDLTTGKLIQNSTATLSDGGIMIVTELDTDSIKSATANSPITIAPDGTGDVHLNTDSVRIGDNNADATIATRGTGDLIITTHEGSANEGIVRLYDGVNGDITLTPNGTGQVKVGTDQVVTLVASQTLTNKTISGSSNTLSNIANASLTNSTISGVALGSNLNALTISSPLTGTSYNGSSAVSIGIPVATTSVNGYLSSADWTTFNNKGSGSVTSVAATVPSLLSISGSPITTSGTLAITYSGTALPVANGGTGLTTLTAGYIPYGAGTSAFGSSANLFWDSTNSRLGIGTASPVTKLNILGSTAASGELGSFAISGSSTAKRVAFGVDSTGTMYGWIQSVESGVGYQNLNLQPLGGNVGIGTASPSAKLEVSGTSASGYIVSTITNLSSTGYAQNLMNIGASGANGQSGIFYAPTIFYKIGIVANDTTTPITFVNNNGTERVRIDSSGNVGIGATTSSGLLTLKNNPSGSAENVLIGLQQNGASTGTIGKLSYQQSDDTMRLYNSSSFAGSALILGTNNTERVRIDLSGNVLVGVTSASYSSANRGVVNLGGSASGLLGFQIGGVAKGYVAHFDSSMQIWNEVASPILFGTSATERMRIDSSGRLGIAVTPSAWQTSSYKVLQISEGGAAFWGQADAVDADISTNAYIDSSYQFRYIKAGAATWYRALDGYFYWNTASSGSANGAISFSERMRLTIDGNLGIGTASPYNLLEANKSGGATISIANSASGAGIMYGKLSFYSTAAAGAYSEYGGQIRSYSGIGIDYGDLRFYTGNGATTAERMRLDSNGDLGIGSSDPSNKLHIAASGLDISGGIAVDGSTMQGIRLQNTVNTNSSLGIWFGTNNVHWCGISGQRTDYATTWGTDLRFYTHEDATSNITYSTERMRITSTQVKATVPFIGNSGTKGFGGITTTTSTSTPTGGSSGDHYYIY